MAFSLAPFVGDGTEANPFRPDVGFYLTFWVVGFDLDGVA